MKKIVFALITIFILTNCSHFTSTKDLKYRADSLEVELNKKENQLSLIINTIDNINTNLQIIKEKENLIAAKSKKYDLEQNESESINQDLQMIYELLAQNKSDIKNLESKLKASSSQNRELKNFIEKLSQTIEEKSEEIAFLQDELKQKNIVIDELNYEVIGLALEMDSIKSKARKISQELESTQDSMNEAFYAIGTKRELKNKNIVVKSGFLSLGSKNILKDDFDKSYFSKTDIRSITEIPLYASKAKVLTSHPAESYSITMGENKDLYLKIKDKKEFWSISKYLVIEVN